MHKILVHVYANSTLIKHNNEYLQLWSLFYCDPFWNTKGCQRVIWDRWIFDSLRPVNHGGYVRATVIWGIFSHYRKLQQQKTHNYASKLHGIKGKWQPVEVGYLNLSIDRPAPVWWFKCECWSRHTQRDQNNRGFWLIYKPTAALINSYNTARKSPDYEHLHNNNKTPNWENQPPAMLNWAAMSIGASNSGILLSVWVTCIIYVVQYIQIEVHEQEYNIQDNHMIFHTGPGG